jgi:autophagy-related protein 2
LLFNSIHIGLDEDIDSQDQDILIDAINKELEDDLETATQSSWQTLPPSSSKTQSPKSKRITTKRLRRSKHPRMEFKLTGIHLEYDQYVPGQTYISRLFVVAKDLEILDHIKQSTWKKFLTDLHADSRGNVRETGSNMVQIELIGVKPVKAHPSEESRLRVCLKAILSKKFYSVSLGQDFAPEALCRPICRGIPQEIL